MQILVQGIAVLQLTNMRLAEMTHDERMVNIKNIDLDIRNEEAKLVKILKNDYKKYSPFGKELCLDIIKELSK